MGGVIPLNHHHIRLLLVTISPTLLILQSVPHFLRLHADVSYTSFSQLDRSNPLLCVVASERSTRGISLVDRKSSYPRRSPVIYGFKPLGLHLDAFQRALTTDPLADSDEDMDRPDDADSRRMDHIDRSKRPTSAFLSLRFTKQYTAQPADCTS